MGSSAMVEAVVEARGFGKRYGSVEAVSDFTLEVRRGELFGLIGPDGGGKSSFMKAVAGVLRFDRGQLSVFGISLERDRDAERIKSRLGLMPQGLGQNLYGSLSVEENVDFFARLREMPTAAAAAAKRKLLAVTRLDAFRGRPMSQLSGGMKQKLGLVCTLVHSPELVILDEPTTGVDPVSRRDFWSILGELLDATGATALVSTAYMDEASRFHRVALCHQGRILGCGSPDQLMRGVPGQIVACRVDDQLAGLERLRARWPQARAQGPWLRVRVLESDAEAEVRSALQPLAIQELQVSAPDLEELFVANVAVAHDPAAPCVRASRAVSLTSAIEAVGLGRRFGDFRAVDNVSFAVPQGEIFGLLGANGAGKTTVIKMLTGILRPTEGQGRVAGVDLGSGGSAVKHRIGYMSQAFSLYRDLTVSENVRLYAGIYGVGADASKRALALSGLLGQERALAGQLPMGLRQRLALSCALVHRPAILFLDEPTSGVDPMGRRTFWDILFQLSRAEGVTILATTHAMSEADQCDHLALMFAGRIVDDSSPDRMKRALVAQAGQLLELRSTPLLKALALGQAHGFSEAALHGSAVHLFAPSLEVGESRLRAAFQGTGVELESLIRREVTMEDVFVHRVTELEQAASR